jgi:hypothetical protein
VNNSTIHLVAEKPFRSILDCYKVNSKKVGGNTFMISFTVPYFGKEKYLIEVERIKKQYGIVKIDVVDEELSWNEEELEDINGIFKRRQLRE